MSTSLDPEPATAAERLDEVARILALGILRLRARRQNSNDPNPLRQFGVDFACEQSVCRREPVEKGEAR